MSRVRLIPKGQDHLTPMPPSSTASARPVTGAALYDGKPHTGVLGGKAPPMMPRSGSKGMFESVAVTGIKSRQPNIGQRIRWIPPKAREE